VVNEEETLTAGTPLETIRRFDRKVEARHDIWNDCHAISEDRFGKLRRIRLVGDD
jgi:hypothetical protein